jgi:transposase
MFKPAAPLWSDANREERLTFLAGAGKTPKKLALRARIVHLAGAGVPNRAIAAQLSLSWPTVLLWWGRFARSGVSGLRKDARRPGRQKTVAPEMIRRVVEATLHTTPPAATMTRAQGLSQMTVQRIWKQHGLPPHRIETFKLSRDPDFVEKLRDVGGLYLDPPDKPLVLSVDENSPIQALDRAARRLPPRPGIPARQTHDETRHGTIPPVTAQSLRDRKVIGACLPRQRSREVLCSLAKIDHETPTDLALDVIVDNSSTHKSSPVRRWLKHPRFHLPFIPTSSSWLNMVERWFGELTPKRIRRGTFGRVKELIAAVTEYLRTRNEAPTRFVGTKDAAMILDKIRRCKEALGTPH